MSDLATNLGLGIFLLGLDALMTFLVVDRVVEHQEEKKRRAVSGLAEARLLESLDALLADGLPVSSRSSDVRLVTVGPSPVALQVGEVDSGSLAGSLEQKPDAVAQLLAEAVDRHGDLLRHPLHLAILEPSLTPALVRVITALDRVEETTGELRSDASQELVEELALLVDQMVEALLELRAGIVERWAQ